MRQLVAIPTAGRGGCRRDRSSRHQTLKRVLWKPGIEEKRFGLAAEEVDLLRIPEGPRILRHTSEAVEPVAGFGEVALLCVGQGQVGPVGGKLQLLGGHSLVDAGDRLIQPAGAEQESAEGVREKVP